MWLVGLLGRQAYYTSGSQKWAIWPPWGPNQVSKGPQENNEKLGGYSNFWVDHRNFTAWIKYFKFKTESKDPFSPASPAAEKAKLYLIAFPHFFGWIWFQFGGLFPVKSR
jgi:hypothetical protein